MTNKYFTLKNSQRERFSAFPIEYAYDKTQLEEAMKKLWAKEVSELMGYYGWAIMLKKDYPSYRKLMDDMEEEMKSFLENDDNLVEAMVYELWNHEYCITYDPSDALRALWVDPSSERVKSCLKRAIPMVMANFND